MFKQFCDKIKIVTKSSLNIFKKILNKIFLWHASIRNFCYKIYRHFIIKFLVIIKKIIIFIILICPIVIILYQTKIGLSLTLSDSYNNLFGVLTSTVGTIIAIFFSLVLIPLNQVASKYSTSFLKYLKRNRFLTFVFSFSILVLTYDVIFLFLGANSEIAISAIFSFILLVLLLGATILYIIKLLNPYNSILLPAHKEIVKKIIKMLPLYEKRYKKIFNKSSKNNKQKDDLLDFSLFKPDDAVTNYIQASLLPIREVAIKAIKDIDLEQSKNAIQTMMSIVVNYLNLRKKYNSDDDPLLYFIYTEFKLITDTASNELKIRLHPFIVDCWCKIGVSAAIVNVKGMNRIENHFNNLVYYPVLGLENLCTLNLLEYDSYAPGKACEALADIGVQLMREGYDKQAVSIIEDLKKISIIAETNKIKNVSGSANYAIMRIYITGVSFRNEGSKDHYNTPYQKINDLIDELLGIFLKAKRNTFDNMILSPFIGNFMDPFKGIYLSRVSEYGIFNDNLNKFSIQMNLECVSSNLKSLKYALELLSPHKDWYFSDQVVENIYRIILNLLSYLDRDIAKDYIIFYKKHPIIDEELSKKSSDILVEGVNILVDFIKNRGDSYLFECDHIHVLFSIYLIILYEYKLRPNQELEDLFNRTHGIMSNLLEDYIKIPEASSNDNLYKYYRLLIDVLNKNNFTELASDFIVPEFEYTKSGSFIYHESIYPETMFDGQWILKRPGFQVNGYYYNDIESALKLDVMKFY